MNKVIAETLARSTDDILTDIQPIKVRDLPAFMQGIRPIAAAFASRDVYAAFAENVDSVIALTALGAGVTTEWLEAQTPDVLIDLATRVIEVNADFFTQKLLPALQRADQRVAKVIGGMSSSMPSLHAATASAT